MTSMPMADVDLLDPDLYALGPPHSLLADLRREAPVHRQERPGLPPFWAVTRHRDVVAASTDWPTFSSARNGVFFDEQPDRGDRNQTLLNLDPPEHTALRAAVGDAFTAGSVERMTRRIRARCTAVLDRVSERGECDFVRDVAAELSLAVLADLLGFPDEEDRRRVQRLTDVLSDPLEQAYPGATADATMELFGFANDLAAWRRQAPTGDLISMLTRAGVDGKRLRTGQFELFFLLLATAGHLTTRYLISGAMLALFEHPDQWARLVADPGPVLDTGVDEMLRWVSPVMQFQRTATRDTELGGQRIPVGDRVALYYVSANRDEAVFDSPDTFDLARTPNRHVSFGSGGPHHCLGNHLARQEIRIVFEEITRRLPDIELAGPPDYLGSTFVNGLRTMPVRFTPTPRVSG